MQYVTFHSCSKNEQDRLETLWHQLKTQYFISIILHHIAPLHWETSNTQFPLYFRGTSSHIFLLTVSARNSPNTNSVKNEADNGGSAVSELSMSMNIAIAHPFMDLLELYKCIKQIFVIFLLLRTEQKNLRFKLVYPNDYFHRSPLTSQRIT